jgi:hypothetical protein
MIEETHFSVGDLVQTYRATGNGKYVRSSPPFNVLILLISRLPDGGWTVLVADRVADVSLLSIDRLLSSLPLEQE